MKSAVLLNRENLVAPVYMKGRRRTRPKVTNAGMGSASLMAMQANICAKRLWRFASAFQTLKSKTIRAGPCAGLRPTYLSIAADKALSLFIAFQANPVRFHITKRSRTNNLSGSLDLIHPNRDLRTSRLLPALAPGLRRRNRRQLSTPRASRPGEDMPPDAPARSMIVPTAAHPPASLIICSYVGGVDVRISGCWQIAFEL